MKFSYILLSSVLITFSSASKAQDSAKVAKTFTELLSICKNVDWSDSNTSKLGTFYKAASYIIYQGDNNSRKWKDVANYKNQQEKTQVDNICFRINGSLNQATEYKIVSYLTQKESEGTWHVLLITYTRKGKEGKAAYAFLKIGDKYALGDID